MSRVLTPRRPGILARETIEPVANPPETLHVVPRRRPIFGTIPVTVRLDPALHEAVTQWTHDERTTKQDLFVSAIKAALRRAGREP